MPPHRLQIPFTRVELESLGARFNLTSKPVKISENILTTGEVEVSNSYEKIDPALHVQEGDQYIAEPVAEDLRRHCQNGIGLIVLVGCPHLGIQQYLALSEDYRYRPHLRAHKRYTPSLAPERCRNGRRTRRHL